MDDCTKQLQQGQVIYLQADSGASGDLVRAHPVFCDGPEFRRCAHKALALPPQQQHHLILQENFQSI